MTKHLSSWANLSRIRSSKLLSRYSRMSSSPLLAERAFCKDMTITDVGFTITKNRLLLWPNVRQARSRWGTQS